MLNSQVQSSPFSEHIIVDRFLTQPNNFDIVAYEKQNSDFILNGKFSIEQYCVCLLHKLFLLDKSDIKPFLRYQCNQLINPFIWLNKFEKLIDLNRQIFKTPVQNIKVEKALMVIELLRQEIENNKYAITSQFNFNRVRANLTQYNTTEEKLSYLYEARANYLQNKPRLLDPVEVPFDQKVNVEIEKIERLEQLKSKVSLKENNHKVNVLLEKIPLNGQVNIIVEAFYQMLYEIKFNNKPYLGASPTTITKLLSTFFIDKDGHPLSESTIQTILSPNKADKRPKGDNRIKLQ